MESSTRSTNRSFKKLLREQKASPEQIYNTICAQTVDLVFTAHPTQVRGCRTSHSPPAASLDAASLHLPPESLTTEGFDSCKVPSFVCYAGAAAVSAEEVQCSAS